MEASKRDFQEIREKITFEIYKDDYQENIELFNKLGAKIKKIDVEGFDYSLDLTWCDLKSKSIKAYKALKDREYDIRNNTNKIN
jgi:hypothetical protein